MFAGELSRTQISPGTRQRESPQATVPRVLPNAPTRLGSALSVATGGRASVRESGPGADPGLAAAGAG